MDNVNANMTGAGQDADVTTPAVGSMLPPERTWGALTMASQNKSLEKILLKFSIMVFQIIN